jgi:transcriptional regulator with XRE-family HTH domain
MSHSTTCALSKAVGAALGAERRRQNLTQDELAAKAGISQGMVAAMERGFRSVTLAKLAKVSAALGRDPVVFFPQQECPSCKGQPKVQTQCLVCGRTR